MSVTGRVSCRDSIRALRARLRSQGGFTMILALAVLMVVSLLTAAVFLAVQSDASLTRADLDGKRAYGAAQSGVQAYLYLLNNNATNSQWWENCTNDKTNGNGTAVQVPGVSYTATYAYTPVPANGASACSSTTPVPSLIDTSTGTLRLEFTGIAGKATTTIVASFKTLSPLSFLWYSVHETVDPSVLISAGYSTAQAQACNTFYSAGSGYLTGTESPPEYCRIYWTTGDVVKGPLYTQDQLLIGQGASPIFGRGPNDAIVSQTSASSVCAFSQCQSATFPGQESTNPSATNQVPLPSDNANLKSDATAHGQLFTGATTVTINPNGTTADVWNCPTSSSCVETPSFDLVAKPIIYAQNSGSSCNTTYAGTSVSYPTSSGNSNSALNGHYDGPCGDVYIQGTYTTPLTIAAANDIIVTDNLQTTEDTSGNPTGSATLGLVAYKYVRVQHDCSGNPPVTIDAAILALADSFFVDDYNCGGAFGSLTIHGALAQYNRGIVGTSGPSGYLKNYNYDDRLGLLLPPYMFDLQNTSWNVYRETQCKTGAATAVGSCTNYS